MYEVAKWVLSTNHMKILIALITLFHLLSVSFAAKWKAVKYNSGIYSGLLFALESEADYEVKLLVRPQQRVEKRETVAQIRRHLINGIYDVQNIKSPVDGSVIFIPYLHSIVSDEEKMGTDEDVVHQSSKEKVILLIEPKYRTRIPTTFSEDILTFKLLRSAL